MPVPACKVAMHVRLQCLCQHGGCLYTLDTSVLSVSIAFHSMIHQMAMLQLGVVTAADVCLYPVCYLLSIHVWPGQGICWRHR